MVMNQYLLVLFTQTDIDSMTLTIESKVVKWGSRLYYQFHKVSLGKTLTGRSTIIMHVQLPDNNFPSIHPSIVYRFILLLVSGGLDHS